jgi:hypothetical protein
MSVAGICSATPVGGMLANGWRTQGKTIAIPTAQRRTQPELIFRIDLIISFHFTILIAPCHK